jgi:hypothetical protein
MNSFASLPIDLGVTEAKTCDQMNAFAMNLRSPGIIGIHWQLNDIKNADLEAVHDALSLPPAATVHPGLPDGDFSTFRLGLIQGVSQAFLPGL